LGRSILQALLIKQLSINMTPTAKSRESNAL
jgi:hypothetical protein